MNLGKQIEVIITEGKHAGTDKFAFPRAIFDYVVEKDPDVGSDLKIPLIFFAEKFLTYYWKMFLYKTQQLTVNGPLRYYVYLRTILKELDLRGVQEGLLDERHIHVLMSELKSRRSLSLKIVTCINLARLMAFRHPIVHSKYISGSNGKVYLDFYKYPETGPFRINAKDYPDLYTHERTFITVRRKYVPELKSMHYWFDKAVLLAWAEFTDNLPSNRREQGRP
jgi:hypothetical protein